ncbi:MAG: phage baseplate assembly protein V [Opitutus sp.]
MSTSIDELDVEREPGPPPSGKFYGKYRGTVVNNIDPLQIGRIMVIVPDVLNVTPGSWALPCVPVAGIQMGMFTVPPPGAGVWVEFEQGDPDFPIWVGCFWGTMAEVPLNAKLVPPGIPAVSITTVLQNGITISDMPPTPLTGGVILKSPTNAMIVVNDAGIFIQNGKGASIMLVGPSVLINNEALVVT